MTLDASIALRRGSLDLAVDLQVADGEVLAVLGPNGAGKSTLCASSPGCCRRTAAPSSSTARPGTTFPRERTCPPHRRPLGVVFQDSLLFPHLSVGDNVAFGLRTRGVRQGAGPGDGRGAG